MFKWIFRAWMLLRVFSLARRLLALATVAGLLTSVGGCMFPPRTQQRRDLQAGRARKLKDAQRHDPFVAVG